VEQPSDSFLQVVSETAWVHGPVQKHGMVPLDRWSIGDYNHHSFEKWLHNETKRRGVSINIPATPPAEPGALEAHADMAQRLGLQHPMSSRCIIWINHAYK
jgi:hypothetical protein